MTSHTEKKPERPEDISREKCCRYIFILHGKSCTGKHPGRNFIDGKIFIDQILKWLIHDQK